MVKENNKIRLINIKDYGKMELNVDKDQSHLKKIKINTKENSHKTNLVEEENIFSLIIVNT